MASAVTEPARLLGAAATRAAFRAVAAGRLLALTAGSVRGRSAAAHALVVRETLRQIRMVGVAALAAVIELGALVGLTAALVSSSLEGVLATIGDPLTVWRSLGVLLLTEIGPFLPALIVAGRCGGVVTADLATMRVAHELDALETSGVDPLHYAVLPRAAALFASTVALTIYFVLAVLATSALCARLFGDLPLRTYLDSAFASVSGGEVLVLVGKSVVFGAIVTAVAVHRGVSASGSRDEVAEAVSDANAQTLAACVVANAAFAVGLYA